MNPFTDIRLDNDIGPLIKQSTGTNASNQVTRQPQEEREPIGQILRNNNPKSQIIRHPSTKVRTRGSLRQQCHTTIISKVEPKHIDDVMEDKN